MSSGQNGAGTSRDTVRSVVRAFAVIKAFGPGRATLTLSEVAEASDLDRATARRLLLTLVDLGYVRTTGRREFALTPRILELGYSYLSGTSLVEVARPHLQRLASELGETASLTVLDGDDVVYVALAPGPHVTAVRLTIGTRFAAYATSMGRVLLADLDPDDLADYLDRVRLDALTSRTVTGTERLGHVLDEVRAAGWAAADGEVANTLRGIAVPVRDRDGRAVAAANVSVHAGSISVEELQADHLPRLRECAQAIGMDLAHR